MLDTACLINSQALLMNGHVLLIMRDAILDTACLNTPKVHLI